MDLGREAAAGAELGRWEGAGVGKCMEEGAESGRDRRGKGDQGSATRATRVGEGEGTFAFPLLVRVEDGTDSEWRERRDEIGPLWIVQGLNWTFS
jgi:hypothetical protein